MNGSQLYFKSLRVLEAGRYLEVEILDDSPEGLVVVIPYKKLRRVNHVDLYYKGDYGQFLRQIFQVLKRKRSRDGVVLTLAPVSASKSAEKREATRIPTAGLCASVDDHDCEVLDISNVGLGVATNEYIEVGAEVQVSLHHKDESHSGTMNVVSSRKTATDQNRYGLRCVADEFDRDALSLALPRIALQLQLMDQTPPPFGS